MCLGTAHACCPAGVPATPVVANNNNNNNNNNVGAAALLGGPANNNNNNNNAGGECLTPTELLLAPSVAAQRLSCLTGVSLRPEVAISLVK